MINNVYIYHHSSIIDEYTVIVALAVFLNLAVEILLVYASNCSTCLCTKKKFNFTVCGNKLKFAVHILRPIVFYMVKFSRACYFRKNLRKSRNSCLFLSCDRWTRGAKVYFKVKVSFY